MPVPEPWAPGPNTAPAMDGARLAILAAAAFASVAGGCQRRMLGEPDAGTPGLVGRDAADPRVDIDAGTARDGSLASDLGVGPAADGSTSDGVIGVGPPITM